MRGAASRAGPAGRRSGLRAAHLVAALAALAAAPARALDEVPFITTPDNVTLELLRLADVGRDDYVIDLGSGDGRIVIVAAQRFGARGLGVEYVPDLVARSRESARRAGVDGRVEFRAQDLFSTDLSAASVVTLYLLTEVNLQLRPRLLALRPGTRVVSHDWEMGDWPPDRTITVDAPEKTIGREKVSRLHLWTVPARIAGRWCAPGGTPVGIEQRVSAARVDVGGARAPLRLTGRVRGARVTVSGAGDALEIDGASSPMRIVAASGRLRAWKGRTLIPTDTASCRPPRAGDARHGWHAVAPMLEPRAAHAVVATAAAVYALAGTGRGGQPVATVERFDGFAWEVETRLPGAGLNAPAAVAHHGRLYVIGGFDTVTNVPSDRVLIYDTVARTWSEGPRLPAPRGGHAAVVLDDRIHVIGGGNSQSTLADHDVLDPALGAWTRLAPLPRAEGSPAAAVYEGRLYAIGGRSGPADFGAVDVYDPTSDAWASGPAIEPRGTAGAVAYCGALHVFGGESQARRASLGDVLRLGSTGWQPVAPLPTPRNFARAVVLGNAVYVVGGSPTPGPSHASEGSAVVERYVGDCALRG
jgi:SAM-dependent methyltransferase